MTITWRATMCVGNTLIDSDHQQLVDLINTVELTLMASGGAQALSDTLDQLTLYTREHFEREETLMKSLRYGRLVQHRQAHRTLRVRLGDIRSRVEAAKAETAPPEEIERLVELLRSWLLDHVLKEDMLLKPSLHGRPPSFTG